MCHFRGSSHTRWQSQASGRSPLISLRKKMMLPMQKIVARNSYVSPQDVSADRNGDATHVHDTSSSAFTHGAEDALAPLLPRFDHPKRRETRHEPLPLGAPERSRTRERKSVEQRGAELAGRSQSVDRGLCASSRAGGTDVDAVLNNYRVAELRGANARQACMGFAVQWLGVRGRGEPASRILSLNADEAENIQYAYEDAAQSAGGNRVQREDARIAARQRILLSRGLQPMGESAMFLVSMQTDALAHIARERQACLVSLCFDRSGKRVRHAVATSSAGGNVSLFDPNYGEFSSSAAGLPDMFEGLMARYGSRMNGYLELESMVIQEVK
jgi:YopT-type cysteine protease-like protein